MSYIEDVIQGRVIPGQKPVSFAVAEKLCKDLAKAYRLASRDVVSYAVAQFVKRAQDLTIRGAGRQRGWGLAATTAEAKRWYKAYLKFRIKGVRFRKWGDLARIMLRGRIRPWHFHRYKIPEKEVNAYYRRAVALTGRFAAGWNTAAFAKKVPVPQFVKKHGARDGGFFTTTMARTYAETVIFDAMSKGSLHGNIDVWVKPALASVEKELSGAKSSRFIAANVRKHLKKLNG